MDGEGAAFSVTDLSREVNYLWLTSGKAQQSFAAMCF